jgi:hypothetical protein
MIAVVSPQGSQAARRQQQLAIFLPFASMEMNAHLRAIDIGNLQKGAFF